MVCSAGGKFYSAFTNTYYQHFSMHYIQILIDKDCSVCSEGMMHSHVFSAVYANDYDYIRSTPAVDDVEVDDTQ